ncbi:MAG TPA: transglycosylase family protein [Candidatus Saccharimonadales bacterium]|nr:transglycosylase family protein [Candidatus Saccharimonadales bacterium]
MQMLRRLITSPHMRYITRYRKVFGVFLLVVGLVLTVTGGAQYAFFEKPPAEEKVLAAVLPTATPEKEIPKVDPKMAIQITFGPPLPATPTVTLTPTITPTPSNNSELSTTTTPTPSPTTILTLTPSPTNVLSSPTPTPTQPVKKTTTASVMSDSVVMFTVTPTPTITPTMDTSSSDDAIWDKLAKCESNNHWDDDTGNGYYGGLQFGQGTWESVGGTGNPAHASREEQIMRGKMLQAKRGWGPWGGCGKMLGLL